MATLSPAPIQKFFAADGVTPLAAGKVYTYQTGSTTPQASYTNASGTLATNPVVLDSKGEAVMYLDTTTAYRFDIKTSADVLVRRVDDIQAAPSSIATSNIQASAVGTTQITADAVTFAKMQNLTGKSLIGKSTAGSGDPEQVSISSDFEFSGSTLQTSTTERVTALSIAAGVVTIDWATSNYFTLTLTSNVTSILFTNVPATAGGRAQSIAIRVIQDATGGRTMSGWPAGTKHYNGTYSPSSAANSIDRLAIEAFATGTLYEISYNKAAA